MVSERKVGLQSCECYDVKIECAKLLHDFMVVSVLMYGNEKMVPRVKEIFRIRAQRMNNLLCSLGITRKDKMPNFVG